MTDRVAWLYHDGGRKAAGFLGEAGDCLVRAVAIATGRPYREVYDEVAAFAKEYEAGRRGHVGLLVATKRGSSPRTGVLRGTAAAYLRGLGTVWTATMGIGTGCRVHVRTSDLPAAGRYVLSLSKHFAAWVDGVLLDTFDCSRDGTRCVYGLWRFQ